jgi:hypothetical protein
MATEFGPERGKSVYKRVKSFGDEHAGIANVLGVIVTILTAGGAWRATTTQHLGVAFSVICFGIAGLCILALYGTAPSRLAGVHLRRPRIGRRLHRRLLWAAAFSCALLALHLFVPVHRIPIPSGNSVDQSDPRPTRQLEEVAEHKDEAVPTPMMSRLQLVEAQMSPCKDDYIQEPPHVLLANPRHYALVNLLERIALSDSKLQADLDGLAKARSRLSHRDKEGAPHAAIAALAEEVRDRNIAVLDEEFVAVKRVLPENTLDEWHFPKL